MAGTALTALVDKAIPVAADLFYIADSALSGLGASKKLTFANLTATLLRNAVAGSSTVPSFAFASQLDSGIYNTASGVAITAKGTVVLILQHNFTPEGNYWQMQPNQAGSSPLLVLGGVDTNTDARIRSKGSGNVTLDGIKYPNADGTAKRALVTDGSNNLTLTGVLKQTALGFHTLFDPLDSTTYYWGRNSVAPVTSEGFAPIIATVTGTIVRVTGTITAFVAGSSETSTLSIRVNGVDTTIDTSMDLSTGAVGIVVDAIVSIAVTVLQKIEFKWVTPAWVTNPTFVSGSLEITIET